MVADDARVIIVGAAPVGLGAALELASCGVHSVLIEKHDATSWHQRTRNVNTRTTEIAYGWGRTADRRLRGIDTPPGAAGLGDRGGFPAAYGIGDGGAVLVCTDGHVPWRSPSGPGDAAVLRDALSRTAQLL